MHNKTKKTDLITYSSEIMTLMYEYVIKYKQKMLTKNKKCRMILCRHA